MTHLTPPVSSATGRGFCGAKVKKLVGAWKYGAVLFVFETEWADVCGSCRARAMEWMKSKDASTVPCFTSVGSVETPAPRNGAEADLFVQLELLPVARAA